MSASAEDDLADIVERIVSLSGVDLTDEAAAEVYRAFCQIGAILAPAIGMHLMNACMSADLKRDVRSPDGLFVPGETPDRIREYNTSVLQEIVRGLKPALSSALPRGDQEIDGILFDLAFEDAPLHLKKIPEKSRGAAGRPHRRLREAARRQIYEIIIYEAARRGCGEASLCVELAPTFSKDDWKRIVREQTSQEMPAKLDADEIRRRAKGALDKPHPKLHWLSNEKFRARAKQV